MDVAIIGRTEILHETAELLHKNGHRIRLIVTAREAPEYKKTAEDFKLLATRLGAKYFYSSKIGSAESLSLIRSLGELDIGVSMNYTNIIPDEVIKLFKHGILNAHGGDLPRYRGNACLAWAILNGETKVGLCIHKMVGGLLDVGDIIAREYMEIGINTKVGEIWEWMSREIPYLFLKALSLLHENKDYILETIQPDSAESLRCYPLMPEDGRIDWNRSNLDILRKINAFNKPYGGAFCELEGAKMTIWDAELYEDGEKYCAIPGQICKVADRYFVVITGSGKLRVNQYECGARVRSIRQRLK